MSQATIYANPTLFFFITENTGSTETATSKDDSTQFKLIIFWFKLRPSRLKRERPCAPCVLCGEKIQNRAEVTVPASDDLRSVLSVSPW